VRYMEALDAAGDRAGALRHAGTHSDLLRTDLAAAPEGEVVALAERLRLESRTAARPSPEPAPTWDVPGISVSSSPAESPGRPSGRRWMLPAVLLLGIALGLGALGAALSRERSASDLNPRRVAVAVFRNRTGRADLDDLGSMTADWIVRGLMETPLIGVTDLEAVYAQTPGQSWRGSDPRTLARRDGAGLIVSGSYYRSGDTVLFEAGIVDVASGRVLRSLDPVGAPADAPAGALKALQEAIGAALGGLIDPANDMSPVDPELVVPPSYPAYREFIAGLRSRTSEDWEGEARHYRRAAELDSTFAAPLVQLAFRAVSHDDCDLTDSIGTALDRRRERLTAWDRFTIDLVRARCRGDMATAVGLLGQRHDAYPQSLTAARQFMIGLQTSNQPRAARRILSDLGQGLDPGEGGDLTDENWALYSYALAASHHMLGEYQAEMEITDRWRDSSAERWLITRGRALAGLGREAEALRLIQSTRGRSIDSVATLDLTIASELAAHGHPGAAAAAAESVLTRLDPDVDTAAAASGSIAWADRLLGRSDAERAALEHVARSTRDTLARLEARARIAVLLADTAEAERIDRILAEQSNRPLRTPTIRAVQILARAHIAAGLGRRDQAVALLRTVGARGMPALGASHAFHADPLLAPLRGYPPFEALLKPDN